jgi:hypothetical protein
MPGAIRRARICRFSICQVRRLAATLGRDHVLPQSHIDQVIGAIGQLETFSSVRKLMDPLRVRPRARAMAAAE